MFADFDPAIVAKLNEKKILAPGSTANSLLSELRLRSIIQNARQISKVGSIKCSSKLLPLHVVMPNYTWVLSIFRLWMNLDHLRNTYGVLSTISL